MNIYTKGGDKGTTSLVHTKNVSKSDDRIQLVGTIDELTSHLGLVKTMLKDEDTIQFLEKIQRTLITVMAGVADPYKRDYRIDDVKTEYLEDEINRMEGLFQRPKEFILPGTCRMSAEEVDKPTEKTSDGGKDEVRTMPENQNQTGAVNEAVIQEVLKRMGIQGRITLASAKRLIEKIEQEAERRGKKAVIAVCGPDGNPIAVHVMDGAFLVSFDVATKKAYTSVAVKMSTKELSVLAQPGGTFYGVDKMDNGKIVIFGGGVPLKVGDTIIGGLGISGGTGEEDHSLAEYGLSVLNEVL